MVGVSSFLSLGALAGSAAAHGFVSGFVTDGTWNQNFILDYYYQRVNTGSFPDVAGWYAENLDSGFIEPSKFNTVDINCHKNAEPGALTATVAAGGTIDFQWTKWPHGIGPMLTYIASCNGDCSTVDKATLQWVKIDEYGIDYDTQVWGAQKFMDSNNTWTTHVPAALAPGNYVFRHETIALHGGGSANGAQAYPQCINIAVTGSGTKALPAGTLGVNLYKATDPGILVNPYTTITNYVIPGPKLWVP